MTEITAYADTIVDRIIAGCARLMKNETGCPVIDYGQDIFDGHPGVVAGDEEELFFALIRFEDARGRYFDGFRPVLAEEIEDGKAAVSAYIDEGGIDPERYAFHFDIIDGAIVGDSDLAVRRLANASVDDPAIVDPDFEKGIFANIASRIEAGENIPHGRIEDVDGEACFIGNYD